MEIKINKITQKQKINKTMISRSKINKLIFKQIILKMKTIISEKNFYNKLKFLSQKN